MRATITLLACVVAIGACLRAEQPSPTRQTVSLSASQKDFLALEPILVRVAVDARQIPSLPATPGSKETLRFEVKPLVKPRPNAKPLPFEASAKTATDRLYDLLEWFQFPAEGQFTVQAIVRHSDSESRSAPISITIRRPDKKDPEWGPVDRLHHIPWSNYITDAFCGDTFDVVKRWPDSKLAKYCHYWNGLHYQHKKEYGKAVESFLRVIRDYRDFPLLPHARLGIIECMPDIETPGSQRGSALPEDLDGLLKKIKEEARKKQ